MKMIERAKQNSKDDHLTEIATTTCKKLLHMELHVEY